MKAWAFYDWANSVYSLVITTAIFPLFYEAVVPEQVTFLGMQFINTALISYVGATGFLIVSFLVPLLSGIADSTDSKRKFLAFFCYLGSISCAALFFFDPEYLGPGLFFYMTALIGFWGSLVFYNSYLPLIAHPEQQDRLSAKGFSLGYIGSSILLILCLALYFWDSSTLKYSFVLTGIWWMGFAQITLSKLPKGKPSERIQAHMLSRGFKELRLVWNQLRHTTRLKRYLQSFFIYSMGVQTVMLVAVYFGSKEISWGSDTEKTAGLIISVLIIQFIAIPGAYLMAYLSNRIGNIRTLMVVNLLWAGICLSALWIETPLEFYIEAGLVGFVMGGIQSLSRSTYSKFLPETKDTASFFSFYDVAEKIGIVFGLFIFAFMEELGNMRMAIVSVLIFFVVGFFMLNRVPKEETTSPELMV